MAADPDDQLVYCVKRARPWGGTPLATSTLSDPEAYHTNKDCPRFKGRKPRKITVAQAKDRDLPLCKWCAGESHRGTGSPQTSCPFCDEPNVRLPSHLPCPEAEK